MSTEWILILIECVLENIIGMRVDNCSCRFLRELAICRVIFRRHQQSLELKYMITFTAGIKVALNVTYWDK